MAYRPELSPFLVVTNGAMASTITSAVTIVQKISMFSYSYVWTGSSPIGSLAVQVSDDYKLSANGLAVINAGTWNTLTLLLAGLAVTSIPISGNSGNGYVDILQSGAYAVRTTYSPQSGSGTLNVTISGKVS